MCAIFGTPWASRALPIFTPSLIRERINEAVENKFWGICVWHPYPAAHKLNLAAWANFAKDPEKSVSTFLKEWCLSEGFENPERIADCYSLLEEASRIMYVEIGFADCMCLRSLFISVFSRIKNKKELDWVDQLYILSLPSKIDQLENELEKVKTAIAIAGECRENSLLCGANMIKAYMNIIINTYKAYYIYGRESDLDTYKGYWTDGAKEIGNCFSKIKESFAELEQAWPEFARQNSIPEASLPLRKILSEL